eukprot:s849_g29.t1
MVLLGSCLCSNEDAQDSTWMPCAVPLVRLLTWSKSEDEPKVHRRQLTEEELRRRRDDAFRLWDSIREHCRWGHTYRQPGPFQYWGEPASKPPASRSYSLRVIFEGYEALLEELLEECEENNRPSPQVQRKLSSLSPLQQLRLNYQPNLPQVLQGPNRLAEEHRKAWWSYMPAKTKTSSYSVPTAPHLTAQHTAKKPTSDEVADVAARHAEDGALTNLMGNAQPISDEKLKELRRKYDKDDNGLSWAEFRELAVEVGELQGLKTPVSEEKLKKIFEGLDADKSGVVSIQEFEAAYAMLEKQLQAAAKAKAKAKAKAQGKAKAEGKAKPKPKPKAEGSIFDALPGFGSFVPELPGLPELPSVELPSVLGEDTRVPQARPIPTPKKTKAPPRVESENSRHH